jgi:type II secretion system protein G
MKNQSRGFTLIELLITVAIIGLLAAIAIPNLLTAIQRSKQKRSMADIRSIAVAWEARAVDMNTYAVSGAVVAGVTVDAKDFSIMAAQLAPTYIKSVPRWDGWNYEYRYMTDAGGANYVVQSPGRNGTFSDTVAPGATRRFDCDIVYSNGAFVQYPDGLQAQ